MHFSRSLAAAATLLAAGLANASVVTFETRLSTASVGSSSATDVAASVEALMAAAPTAGYCNATPAAWAGLSNQAVCGGSGGDIAFDITADFSVSAAAAGLWQFRIGPDFGRGGVLFVDGMAYDLTASDMWWDGSFADPTQTLTASVTLGAGNHRVEAYGFEPCCDGSQIGQFLAPSANDWVTFSTSDGRDPSNVPEPTSALLALGALAALRAAGRKRG